MTFSFEQAFETFVAQAPLAGAAVYVAKIYMKKHEEAVNKLMTVFEAEIKACEGRYQMVFDELMKLKEKLKS